MVYRAFVVSGLILLAGCPSKKDDERFKRKTIDELTAFRDRACACKDMACADQVQEELSTWSLKTARESVAHKPDNRADDPMPTMEIGRELSECIKELIRLAPNYVPPTGDARDADSVLRNARVWARVKHPDLLLWSAQFAYVDAHGQFDDDRGYASIIFGRPRGKPGDCFQLGWAPRRGWTRVPNDCYETFDVTNKCTSVQAWKKAIVRGAPETGVATMHFHSNDGTGSWDFVLDDESRNIHVRQVLDDEDCQLAVKQ